MLVVENFNQNPAKQMCFLVLLILPVPNKVYVSPVALHQPRRHLQGGMSAGNF